MKYGKLGSTGLDISRVCLGCMSFGIPDRGRHSWTLDEDASRPIIRRAVEAGITFFDTANVYSDGTSEEIVGKLIAEVLPRHDAVIATKVGAPMREVPNGGGVSRKVILTEIDASLKRLGTDYVDLYQIHRLDGVTPFEETLEALHDVVKAGKARYIGLSSTHAWQLATMLHISERNGWTRFVSMQNYVNLLYREEEREMLPLCQAEGIGLIPWSPLARGRLTRPWNVQTERSQADGVASMLYQNTQDADRAVVEAAAQVASGRGVPMAQFALAWLLSKQGISAPIVGVTNLDQLGDAVAAVDLVLSDEEVAHLEAPYVAHQVVGIS